VRNRLSTVLLSLVVVSLSGCNRDHKPIAPAADLSVDECKVFSGYIADTFSRRRKEQDSKQPAKLVFLNTTNSGDDDLLPDENGHSVPWEKTAESLRKKAPSLQQATIDSFRKANSQQALLHRSISSPIDYEVVTSAQLEPIFCKHCGDWPEYYKRFPGAGGIVTWSRVGFNSDGTQALFYESYRCGGLCGSGRYMVMDKKNGSWMIGTDIVVWVS
jgi:hypothetical protein